MLNEVENFEALCNFVNYSTTTRRYTMHAARELLYFYLKVTCNQKSSFYHSKESHPVNTLAKFYSCVVNI